LGAVLVFVVVVAALGLSAVGHLAAAAAAAVRFDAEVVDLPPSVVLLANAACYISGDSVPVVVGMTLGVGDPTRAPSFRVSPSR
jgi:hypothetical protein